MITSRTKNKQSRNTLIKMLERAFPDGRLATGENAITEVEGGWFNAIYALQFEDQREVILKVAPAQHIQVMRYEVNIIETEVAMMRLVAQAPNIPVPQVYAYDTSHDLCDADYFFMQKMDGVDLEACKATLSPAELAPIEEHVGRIIYAINQFTGDYFGYPGNAELQAKTWREAFIKIVDSVLQDGQEKKVDYYGIPIVSIKALVLKHAAALEEVTVPRLVHWDGWDKNFLAQDGRLSAVLDFERALWGDPLMEEMFRPVIHGEVTAMMTGYGKTEFTHTERQRCHLYTLYLGLIMRTEGYYRGYPSGFTNSISQGLMEPSIQWLNDH